MMLLTKLRVEQGLSKSELARRAGMHVSSISHIEAGRLVPYPNQIRKLSLALGWEGSPAELFGASDVVEAG